MIVHCSWLIVDVDVDVDVDDVDDDDDDDAGGGGGGGDGDGGDDLSVAIMAFALWRYKKSCFPWSNVAWTVRSSARPIPSTFSPRNLTLCPSPRPVGIEHQYRGRITTICIQLYYKVSKVHNVAI